MRFVFEVRHPGLSTREQETSMLRFEEGEGMPTFGLTDGCAAAHIPMLSRLCVL